MRFLIVAVLGFALAATPAMAQQHNGSSTGRVFGNANCPAIPCPGTPGAYLTSSDYIANINGCIQQHFGVDSSSMFDSTSSLDESNCLTTSQNFTNKGVMPKCCMVALPQNKCMFHCSMVTQ